MRILLTLIVGIAVVSCIGTAVAGAVIGDAFVVVCSLGLLAAVAGGLRLATK